MPLSTCRRCGRPVALGCDSKGNLVFYDPDAVADGDVVLARGTLVRAATLLDTDVPRFARHERSCPRAAETAQPAEGGA